MPQLDGDIPRLKQCLELPEAWTAPQMQRLIESIWKHDNRLFWASLVATIYSTSERIGALLQTPADGFDGQEST
jgi:hypothetical protein